MEDAFYGWLIAAVTFAVNCALVHFAIPGGILFGAPPWAWGLAAVVGVTSATHAKG